MGSLLDHLSESSVITGVLKRVRDAVMKQGVRMMLHTFEDATLLALKPDGRAMSFCELEKARKTDSLLGPPALQTHFGHLSFRTKRE